MNRKNVEPKQIENSLYWNPVYQFPLRIPNGWEVSENISEVIKRQSCLSNQTLKTAIQLLAGQKQHPENFKNTIMVIQSFNLL